MKFSILILVLCAQVALGLQYNWSNHLATFYNTMQLFVFMIYNKYFMTCTNATECLRQKN